jgi:hypothetical protein
LNTYLLIDLNEEGLLLRFEPRTQRLHSIEVYDLTRVVLRYCGVAFSGPDTLPTFVLIYGRFGPSFPGEYNRDRQTYCLDYPVTPSATLIIVSCVCVCVCVRALCVRRVCRVCVCRVLCDSRQSL